MLCNPKQNFYFYYWWAEKKMRRHNNEYDELVKPVFNVCAFRSRWEMLLLFFCWKIQAANPLSVVFRIVVIVSTYFVAFLAMLLPFFISFGFVYDLIITTYTFMAFQMHIPHHCRRKNNTDFAIDFIHDLFVLSVCLKENWSTVGSFCKMKCQTMRWCM